MSARPAICILINSLAGGGAEKVVATLYPEYRKMPFEFFLVCLERHDVLQIENAQPHYLHQSDQAGSSGTGKLFGLLSLAKRFRHFVRKNDITLVQSHLYRANYVNVLAKLLGAGHKAQLVNHGMPSQYRREGIKGMISLALIRGLYPRADALVCPARGMFTEFRSMNAACENNSVIPNPVDAQRIQTLSIAPLADLGIGREPGGRPYLLAMGRLVAVKRMQDIVRAFAAVAAESPDLDLVILGEGPEEKALSGLIGELDLTQRVTLRGYLRNPYPCLANAFALISASEAEGFSLVIAEALSLGVPVISTDCPSGPREILSEDNGREPTDKLDGVEIVKHGILVPVADLEAIETAMKRLASDEAARREMVQAGPGRASDYAKGRIARLHERQWEAMLA